MFNFNRKWQRCLPARGNRGTIHRTSQAGWTVCISSLSRSVQRPSQYHLPLISQPRAHRRSSSSCFTLSITYYSMFRSYVRSLDDKVEKTEDLLHKVRAEVLRCDGKISMDSRRSFVRKRIRRRNSRPFRHFQTSRGYPEHVTYLGAFPEPRRVRSGGP